MCLYAACISSLFYVIFLFFRRHLFQFNLDIAFVGYLAHTESKKKEEKKSGEVAKFQPRPAPARPSQSRSISNPNKRLVHVQYIICMPLSINISCLSVLFHTYNNMYNRYVCPQKAISRQNSAQKKNLQNLLSAICFQTQRR